MIVGLISDTHGLLRPQALAALRGSDLILHAGDIGDAAILEQLAAIAPIHAVRGNNDTEGPEAALPETLLVEAGGRRLYLLHDLKELRVNPAAERMAAVISGHSHRPKIETRQGVLYVNPGSAGPRRFSLPIALARMTLGPSGVEAEIVTLA
ncbi:metallophosphoesterase [Solimonas sp. K1W22B-7]|uniref:metallophosphoesterase family protein n=1 Tax=Solimonas sp. K1W22B-7 TaxID=2303331 RepID=UPI000E3357A6|nr:metallophosphoesterase family protein [Solimonas sp. K1W22B-7]AXQ27228.1 metallophosphoesterase [Solimonas sp. K1W22B-7]